MVIYEDGVKMYFLPESACLLPSILWWCRSNRPGPRGNGVDSTLGSGSHVKWKPWEDETWNGDGRLNYSLLFFKNDYPVFDKSQNYFQNVG